MFFVIRSYKNAYMMHTCRIEQMRNTGTFCAVGISKNVTKATGKPFSILALKGAVMRCEYVFATVKMSLQLVPFLLIINL